MRKLVKMIKLNNLQYNANRDPQFYRRLPNEEFRLQVFLEGRGQARARLEAEDRTLCDAQIELPGVLDCRFAFDTAGVRIGTLTVEGEGETHRQDLRLDVIAEAWVG
ncbi:MAG: hypothetical protein GWO02_08095 [Gammaproteobacteria bacterium]|nr:hypothetical protein [Gammaproteobacteria bacterium]